MAPSPRIRKNTQSAQIVLDDESPELDSGEEKDMSTKAPDKKTWKNVHSQDPNKKKAVSLLRKKAGVGNRRVTSVKVSKDGKIFQGRVHIDVDKGPETIEVENTSKSVEVPAKKAEKAKPAKKAEKAKPAKKAEKAKPVKKAEKAGYKPIPAVPVTEYFLYGMLAFEVSTDVNNPTFDPRAMRQPKDDIVDSIDVDEVLYPIDYVELEAKKGAWAAGKYVTEGRQRIINGREYICRKFEAFLGVELERGPGLLKKLRELAANDAKECYEGLNRVKAREVKIDENSTFWRRSRVANSYRSGDSQFEEAFNMKIGLDKGIEIEEVAREHNCTVKTVKNRLALLEVPKPVLGLCLEGEITVSDLHTVRKEKKTESARVAFAEKIAEGRKDGSWKPRAVNKKKSKFKAPKVADLRKVANNLKAGDSDQARDMILWFCGDVSVETLVQRFPSLAKTLADQGLYEEPDTGEVEGAENIRLRYKDISNPKSKVLQKVCKTESGAVEWIKEKLGDGPYAPSGAKGEMIINKDQTGSVTVKGDRTVVELLTTLND